MSYFASNHFIIKKDVFDSDILISAKARHVVHHTTKDLSEINNLLESFLNRDGYWCIISSV